MKQIAVIIAGTGKTHTADIEPGTTPLDILRHLNLDGMSLLSSAGNRFVNDENMYVAVDPGDKITAVQDAPVGMF